MGSRKLRRGLKLIKEVKDLKTEKFQTRMVKVKSPFLKTWALKLRIKNQPKKLTKRKQRKSRRKIKKMSPKKVRRTKTIKVSTKIKISMVQSSRIPTQRKNSLLLRLATIFPGLIGTS